MKLIFQIPEGRLHILMKLFEVCLYFSLAILYGIFELHRRQLVKDIAHSFTDYIPGDFIFWLRCRFHRVTSHIIKGHNVAKHADRLVEWTISEKFQMVKRYEIYDNVFRGCKEQVNLISDSLFNILSIFRRFLFSQHLPLFRKYVYNVLYKLKKF